MTTSSKLTLFIDTSANLQVALLDEKGALVANRSNEKGRTDNQLGRLVDECLQDAEASYASIKAGMVCRGPGSFTGLRVGIAFVQGICFPDNLPIYTFSSLRAMKLIASKAPVGALMDAGRDQFYYSEGNPESPDTGDEVLISTHLLKKKIPALNSLVISGNLANFPDFLFNDYPFQPIDIQKNYPFELICKYALNHPSDNGIIKANYIQKSAAELNLEKLNDSRDEGKRPG